MSLEHHYENIVILEMHTRTWQFYSVASCFSFEIRILEVPELSGGTREPVHLVRTGAAAVLHRKRLGRGNHRR